MDALRTFLALNRWDALVASARQPSPSLPHVFRPRKHGSRSACEICGGHPDDQIHVERPPRPSRRRDGSGHLAGVGR